MKKQERFSGFSFSDRGFAISFDVAMAIFLVSSFLAVAFILPFDRPSVQQVADYGLFSQDSLVALDESGFLMSTLDSNLLDDSQKMDAIAQKLRFLLPSRLDFHMELVEYDYNALECRTDSNFFSCFFLKKTFPSYGPVSPSDKTVSFNRLPVVRRAPPTSCEISTAAASLLGKGTNPARKSSSVLSDNPFSSAFSKRAFFSEAGSSMVFDLTTSEGHTGQLFFSAASDANIVLGVQTTPSGTVFCDENVRVDLNVSVLNKGRNPVDIMLVMDRSGSMSWDGHAGGSNSQELILDNNTVFLADGSSGLRDANVENPRLPVLMGQYNSPGTAYDVAKQGNYLFVADGSSGLRIVDNPSPGTLNSVGSLSGIGTANGIGVKDNYAFVASTTSSLLYDVTISTQQDTYLRIGYSAAESWAGQSFTAVAGVMSGVSLYLRRYSNPTGLTVHLRTSINGPDLVSATYPASSVSTSGYGWENVDWPAPQLLDPGSVYFVVVTTTSQSTTSYYRWGMRNSNSYSGGQAYQQSTGQSTDLDMRTYNREGLQVIDVADKGAPVWMGSFRVDNGGKMWIQNNNLFLTDGSSGIKIFDISTPRSPALVGQFDTTDAQSVFVSGSTAFVADGSSGLRILDVSTLSNPSQISSYNTPDSSLDVWVDNALAYIADDTSLQVVDVSVPAAPVFAFGFSTPYQYEGVVGRDNTAYIASQSQGLITIGIPAGPRITQAKAAGSVFLGFDLWQPEDQLGLASFSSSSTLNQELTSDLSDVNTALFGLVANGATNIESGLDEAIDELRFGDNANPEALKFIVLLSDGQSNSGDSTTAAQEAADHNIIVYPIAFGLDAYMPELETIASITSGEAYFAGDQNALVTLYAIIAQEIGDLAAVGTSEANDANVLVPILDGTTIQDSGGASLIFDGDDRFLFYEIGDLNKGNRVWSGYYIFSFDCNSSESCSDENRVIPVSGTVLEWRDENNYLQAPLPWDINVIILLKYRDLTLRVFGADPVVSGGVLLDINAINAGYLSTPATAIEIRKDTPGGTLLKTIPVSAFACGQRELSCEVFSEVFYDQDSQESGTLFASINRDQSIRECPNNNVVEINCAAGKMNFFEILLWTWQKD